MKRYSAIFGTCAKIGQSVGKRQSPFTMETAALGDIESQWIRPWSEKDSGARHSLRAHGGHLTCIRYVERVFNQIQRVITYKAQV